MTKLMLAVAVVVGLVAVTGCETTAAQKEAMAFRDMCQAKPLTQVCVDHRAMYNN